MEIKKIKLSAKRGGNGYISSYSVNIGSNEAQICGLRSEERPILLCKVIDDENKQIVVKPKRYTLTGEMVQAVISTASNLESVSNLQIQAIPHRSEGIINMSDIPEPNQDVRKARAELKETLMLLSYEEITDLVTLMLIGADRDADMTLDKADRFLDYWAYLSGSNLFNSKESMIAYMMEKGPLAQYLRCGLDILNEPARKTQHSVDFNEW